MRSADEVSKDELRELLGKGWLTHDGAWFVSVAQEMGMEAANRMNKAAIRAMAPFETRRTMKVLGVTREELADFTVVKDFVGAGLGLIMPDSVVTRLHLDYPEENVMRWRWDPGQCFAFKSMTQLGLAEQYECGVLYRIGCWLDALGIAYEMTPRPVMCRMLEDGECAGEFVFRLQ